jgi:hypothetical protein
VRREGKILSVRVENDIRLSARRYSTAERNIDFRHARRGQRIGPNSDGTVAAVVARMFSPFFGLLNKGRLNEPSLSARPRRPDLQCLGDLYARGGRWSMALMSAQ